MQRGALNPVEAYERGFAEVYGAPHVVATNSGTAAYLAALLSLRLPRAQRVLLPAYAWPQLVAVPRALGYRVSFIDTDAHGRIDVDRLAVALTPKTGVLVVCHLFGNPNDMVSVASLARERGVFVIEDCSQALYAAIRGRRVGLWGDVAFCSTGAGKLLDTGEGGLLWTGSRILCERAYALTQGPLRSTETTLANLTLACSLSLRLHPAGARSGVASLRDLARRVARRSAYYEQARSLLRCVPNLVLPEVHAGAKASWTHCPASLPSAGAGWLAPYLWDKRPAYLLAQGRAFRRAQAFDRDVEFFHLEEASADEDLATLAALVRDHAPSEDLSS